MTLPPLLLGFASLLVAGCTSLSDAAHEARGRLAARDEPKTRIFATPTRVAYEAVRSAARQMGYRFVRGGPAQGEFEALSGVGPGEASGSSRQVAVKVRLHAMSDGTGTEIAVRFTEIIEADSANRAGIATESPLRDTPQYEVFFRHVQGALDAAAR